MASTMVNNNLLSTGGGKPDFKLPISMPMPPPLLHTRSGNALYDRPSTPTGNGFTTPYVTPQGSPSKNKLPPGANDLPNVFDDAMRLTPTSPTKGGRQQLSPNSPNKAGRNGMEDRLDENIMRQEYLSAPGSPLRKSGKENTPPGGRMVKEVGTTTNQAAVSRQEPYQTRETSNASERARYSPTRGLTTEELEKLQLPKVKRLANVTQICKLSYWSATGDY